MGNLPNRPTHRTIAREANVSNVTVSLALRNHPSIPESTRARIREIAETQGYRPDPKLNELMHHLRTHRNQKFSSNLAALRLRPERETHYNSRVLAGVAEQARRYGYSLEVIDLDKPSLPPRRLRKILYSRGIEGVVLLPMEPVDLSDLVDWSAYSVVATSHSILKPRFHSVVPNQFSNMLRLCERLAAVGEKRIGIVMTVVQELKVNHRFTGAYLWNTMMKGWPLIPPLIVDSGELKREVLMKWIEKHDPRVVITFQKVMEAVNTQLPASVRNRILWARTGVDPGAKDQWGILENAEEIGRAAMDVLVGMIHRGYRGIPETPRCTEIEGTVRLNRQ